MASALCVDCPYRMGIREVIDLRAQLGSALALNEKLRDQLRAKEEEIAALKATVRKREHQAFGRKSEKQRARSESSASCYACTKPAS